MAIGVVLALLVISCAVAAKRPRHVLLGAIFLLPWQDIVVDVGLTVTASLGVVVALCVVMGLRLLQSNNASTSKLALSTMGVWCFLLAYAVLWTLIQLPLLPDSDVSGGLLRSPKFRAITQIVMFIITASPIFFVPFFMRTVDDYVSMARIYLLSVTLLALIGWLQIVTLIMTGSEPIFITFIHSFLSENDSIRSAWFGFQGDMVYRMSSLGGDPKRLGASLSVGLLLLQAGFRPAGIRGQWLWMILLASLIATFSTMGLLVWAGASVVQLVTAQGPRSKSSAAGKRWRVSLLVSTMILALLAMSVIFGSNLDTRLNALIKLRTVDRIAEAERGVLEDFNVAIYDFLRDQPLLAITGVGLGNAHLYADPYLPEYARRYAGGSAFAAKSGGLRWISELGVVSLGLFIAWILYIRTRAVTGLSSSPIMGGIAVVVAKFSVPMVAMWLVSGYVTPQFYFMLGTLVGLRMVSKQRVRFERPIQMTTNSPISGLVPGMSPDY